MILLADTNNRLNLIQLNNMRQSVFDMNPYIEAGIPAEIIIDYVRLRESNGSRQTQKSLKDNLYRASKGVVNIEGVALTPAEILGVTVKLGWSGVNTEWIENRIELVGNDKFLEKVLIPVRKLYDLKPMDESTLSMR